MNQLERSGYRYAEHRNRARASFASQGDELYLVIGGNLAVEALHL